MDSRENIMLMYVGFGLLLSVLAIPMILRKIKPNPFYGFRVPKAINNPEIWYEINAYSGYWFFATGLVSAVMAAVVYVLPGLDNASSSLIQAGVVFALLTIGIVMSFRRLSRM